MTVLCMVEHENGAPIDASLRALTMARGLADSGNVDGIRSVVAVLFGQADQIDRDALANYGATAACVIGPAQVPGYAPLAWARVLAGLRAADEAGAVVAAATDRGNEVMAHLGAITGLPVAANCVSAERSGDGACRLTRHRWGGLLLEDAVLEAPAALLTVAAEAVAPVPLEAPTSIEVRGFETELTKDDLRVIASESAERAGGATLANARVVVGGGRGVGGPEGFTPLEELAGLLGGVVGVSRVVTSEGWRPHTQQVGQTGTRITPEVYLACGISGAIQHMAGCSGARHIIAVNSDPGAPMMSKADYAVVGDLHEVVPALIEAIKSRGEGAGGGR